MADGTNGATSGQEPTARTNVPSGRASYSPQAGDAGADERPGADGGAHSPNAQQPPSADDDMTPEQYRAALKAARTDAAENRKARQELDALKRKLEDEKLTESERLQKERDDAKAEVAAITLQAQERVIRAEVRSTARELGIKPELALRLIDMAAIEFTDDGDPTNIHELIEQAIQEFGLAAATPPAPPAAARQSAQGPQGQQPQQPRTGATNPPRGGQIAGANGVFAANEIPRLNDPRLWKR